MRAAVFWIVIGSCGVGLLAASWLDPPRDRGSVGAWEKLLALGTTSSLLHTTAHPDDEHGGVLAWLSRGRGTRIGLLSLTRGEAGDNAIGPELFDGLGVIRTEELLLACRHYGVDALYFTTAVDFGFCKRLDEALAKWDREHVLREMVHIIRVDRPFVVVSRFQGSERDGHGHHQAAGLLSREAFEAAGDPEAFPEQIAAGLRPWKPLKLYVGVGEEDREWTVRVDTGRYAPWLGDSYENIAQEGLSLQRSQTAGRSRRLTGSFHRYYKRLEPPSTGGEKEEDLFDGIDVSLPGLYGAQGTPAPAGAVDLLNVIDRQVREALRSFRMADPSASVPALARGLGATREAIHKLEADPEVVFVLQIKERQFMAAIHAALSVDVRGEACRGEPEPPAPDFAPRPVMGPAVPGGTFRVRAEITNPSAVEILPESIRLDAPGDWNLSARTAVERAGLSMNEKTSQTFDVRLPPGAGVWRPHFSRTGIQDDRYDVTSPETFYLPWPEPAAVVEVTYRVDGVPVQVRRTVHRFEANPPYGYEARELEVLPRIAVYVTPRTAVIPIEAVDSRVVLRVEIVNQGEDTAQGRIGLRLPGGWRARPEEQTFHFSRAGERSEHVFEVTAAAIGEEEYVIEASASLGEEEFSRGFDVIRHRDLETRYLYRDAVSRVRGVNVRRPEGLLVGYVMGIGDRVPSAIGELGADVRLLGEADLATADLGRFDAVMLGTRAYAVRDDLKAYNRRLLDYVRDGGNLIVLYNTPELIPSEFAPFPGELPQRAEEVTEEDSPVDILVPDHPVLQWPNRIAEADFRGWVEQRGSKFWSAWDRAYTPIIATHDTGQESQKGGWLSARYGKGVYTYFAYALHRQLPYGVPGAYRLLANLLSQSRKP